MAKWLKSKCVAVIGIICFVVLLIFGNYGLERHQFGVLITTFSLLFVLYAGISRLDWAKQHQFILGMLCRVVLLLAIPNLSDDFWRFVWDGALLNEGVNPFSYHPIEVDFSADAIYADWLAKMNSPTYYSVYPPVLQGVFALAARCGISVLGMVIILKLCILASEWCTLIGLKRLIGPKSVWYALNPLVILELTGNIHFEAFMITGLVWALVWLNQSQQTFKAGLALLLAVSAKLNPLLFLPALLRFIGFWRTVIVGFICVVGLCVQLALFWPDVVNMLDSVRLYFQTFEFNASLYYVARWLGYRITGYNQIAIIGQLFFVISFSLIVLVALVKKPRNVQQLSAKWMWMYFVYLLFATIVHPWYAIPLIPLGLIAGWIFPIFWSYFILVSYFAYSNSTYTESMPLLVLQYFCLVGVILFEYQYKRKLK